MFRFVKYWFVSQVALALLLGGYSHVVEYRRTWIFADPSRPDVILAEIDTFDPQGPVPTPRLLVLVLSPIELVLDVLAVGGVVGSETTRLRGGTALGGMRALLLPGELAFTVKGPPPGRGTLMLTADQIEGLRRAARGGEAEDDLCRWINVPRARLVRCDVNEEALR
jgi:hypothetical protein